jgi:hypothetical protein
MGRKQSNSVRYLGVHSEQPTQLSNSYDGQRRRPPHTWLAGVQVAHFLQAPSQPWVVAFWTAVQHALPPDGNSAGLRLVAAASPSVAELLCDGHPAVQDAQQPRTSKLCNLPDALHAALARSHVLHTAARSQLLLDFGEANVLPAGCTPDWLHPSARLRRCRRLRRVQRWRFACAPRTPRRRTTCWRRRSAMPISQPPRICAAYASRGRQTAARTGPP